MFATESYMLTKSLRQATTRSTARNLSFLLFLILPLILLRIPLTGLVRLALDDERRSYILFIPFISAWLVWLERKRIFPESHYCPGVGISLLLVGFIVARVVEFRSPSFHQNDRLAVAVLALGLIWIGGFTLSYGTRVLHRAIFPALFLLLMIPIPYDILEKIDVASQKGSAEVTDGLFRLVGVPVFREGFRFAMPGVEIEIAEKCSGIRSGLCFLISSILAGHLFLRSKWRKVSLTLLAVPVIIFKNAVRIVTISWLGIYVDRGFLYGRLHRYGGLPFSILGLVILASVLLVLQKSERQPDGVAGRNQEVPLQETTA